MKFVPKIVYGSGPTTLILTYPVKIWTPDVVLTGGSAVADSGVPESYIVRREQRVKFDLRFSEDEWVAVDTWVAFGQASQPFDFYFDKDVATKYTVYLDEPAPGDGEVSPTREANTRLYSLPVTLRTVDKSRFNTLIFS